MAEISIWICFKCNHKLKVWQLSVFQKINKNIRCVCLHSRESILQAQSCSGNRCRCRLAETLICYTGTTCEWKHMRASVCVWLCMCVRYAQPASERQRGWLGFGFFAFFFFFFWKWENKSKRSSGQGGMGGLQGFRSLNCRPPNKITLKCH